METTTPDKPEVVAMAVRLKMKDQDTVTGKLVRLWAWADQNSVDGHAVGVTRAFVDRLVACQGFAAALEAVGWLAGPDGAIDFPGFDRHNGDSAKKRAGEARKKQHQRHGKKGTNVPLAAGQTGGPEEEIEFRERESVREAQGISNPAAADPLVGLLLSLRPEWQASPELNEDEAAAFAKARRVFAAITPATWEMMRRFMNHRFGEGDARWQPVKRLVAIRTIGDIAAHADSWSRRAGTGAKAEAVPWPEKFERWAKERYPSTPARVLWLSPSMREDWENSQAGEEDAA